MANNNLQPMTDPDDLFADTRMSFGDHIEELRGHLIRAMLGFVIAMVICVLPPIGPFAVKFITKPIEDELKEFYDRYINNRFEIMKDELVRKVRPIPVTIDIHIPSFKQALEGKNVAAAKKEPILEAIDQTYRDLGLDPQAVGNDSGDWIELPVKLRDPVKIAKVMSDVNREIAPKLLATMNVQEAFIVYFKVGLLFGFVLSSPWVFYQLWSFVAAGLYPHEKKLVNYYLPISLGLFLAGFFVCEFLALPKAIEALLWFNEWLGFEPELRLNEWLSFAIIMPLVFGLSFQTPLVMMFLYKIGIADLDTFRKKRNISYFIMAAFSAIITPSTDAPTMLMLWVPMCLLYELGIWMCKMQPQTLLDNFDESELDEMVGV